MRLPKDHLEKILRDLARILWPPVVVLALHVLRQLVWPFASEWDMVMHFLGGASIAAAASVYYAILRERGLLAPLPFPLFGLLIVSVAATVGVFWEFFEWTIFHTILTYPPGVDVWTDTVQDLALDSLGAVIWSALEGFRRRP